MAKKRGRPSKNQDQAQAQDQVTNESVVTEDTEGKQATEVEVTTTEADKPKAPAKSKEVDELAKYGLAMYDKIELARRDPHTDARILSKEADGTRVVELYRKVKRVKISDQGAADLNNQAPNSRFAYLKEGQTSFEAWDTGAQKMATYKVKKPNI